VGDVGDLGEKALGPGGAVTKTLGGVGQAAQQAVKPGGAASQAVGGLTDAAGQALGPDSAVGQLGGTLGQAAGGARETLENAAARIGGPIAEKISTLAEKVGIDDAGQELPAPAQAGPSDHAKREQDRQQREQRRKERRRALQ
jgi:pyruvate carboxylase